MPFLKGIGAFYGQEKEMNISSLPCCVLLIHLNKEINTIFLLEKIHTFPPIIRGIVW